MATYNATVYRDDGEGQQLSVFTAQVTPGGVMLASNAVQCTGLEGTEAYDGYVRRIAFAGCTLRIVQDGCQGYRDRIRGLAVPSAYKGA